MRKDLACFFLFLLLAAWSEVSLAQEADGEADGKSEKAKEHFSKGVYLFQEGNMADALVEFNASYKLHPHWKILYNIGSCYMELGDFPKAATKLSYFVEEGGSEIGSDVMMEVADTLRDLKSRLGVIRLTGDFEGTTLFINDREDKRGGAGKDVFVSPGLHRIKLLRGEMVIIEKEIAINAGQEKEIFVVESSTPGVENVVEVKDVKTGEGEGVDEGGGGGELVPEGLAQKPKKGMKQAAYASLAMALAFLATGGVTGGLAIKEKNDAKDAEKEYNDIADPTPAQYEQLKSERDSHFDKAMSCSIASTVFFAVGGAAAVMTAVFFPLAYASKGKGKEKKKPETATVSLLPGLQSLDLIVRF
jgi:tetratricopeptide (TPR) repeat protein